MPPNPARPFVYLGAPYTHTDPHIQEQRFQLVTIFAHRACLQDHIIYSPITHCHPIDQFAPGRISYDHWMSYADAFVPRCTSFWLLRLEGWKLSKGLAYAVNLAVANNISICHFDFGDDIPYLLT